MDIPFFMNCLLFHTTPPFELAPNDTKLAHIDGVLKTANGGEIFAGTLNGKLWICRFIRRSDGGAELVPVREIANPDRLGVCLAVAFARPQIAQRILFEAACFGVDKLVFYAATKGEADYAKSGLYTKGEYLKWLEKGAEQSCSTYIPEFSTAANLEEAAEELLAGVSADALKIAPDVYEAEAGLPDALADRQNRTVCALLGGERGLTAADRNALRSRGFKLVSLGRRVLRTDSAVIATLAGCVF